MLNVLRATIKVCRELRKADRPNKGSVKVY